MDHDEDAPPPPYSAIDPLQLQETNNAGSRAASESQIGHDNPPGHGSDSQSDSRPLETSFSEIHIHDNVNNNSRRTPSSSNVPVITATETPQAESSSARQPTHFASAAGYFAERPSLSENEKRDTLVHHMTIYARSQGKDFPRRPRCWRSRATEINQHDWDTFLNFLFPSNLGPAALSSRLHRRVRAEIERDRKDRPQETDDERCARLDAVIMEWNDHFFNPRGTYVTWVYIADLETGPMSPLCPNCYPQATEASQNHNRPSRTPSTNAPIPVSTEQPVHKIPRRPVPRSTYPGPEQGSQRSSVALSPLPGTTTTGSTTLSHHATVPLTKSYQNPYTSAYPWATNPVAWASQVSLRAQQYAEKVSAQAQEYGRAIEESALARSRQVEYYSKRLEDNAIAHGKRLEEAALARGRKIEQAGDRLGNWATGMAGMAGIARRRASSNVLSAYEEPDSPTSRSVGNVQPVSRRLSTASNASSIGSIDSLSSIDTISTTSELEPDDLAAVRAQLNSLDEYHHRDLHSAAVGLRSHIRILQQTRRDSRFLLPRVGQRGSWGRWDSPDDEIQRENRRVQMKEETRLLRQAFRESSRRAKQEVRELQRARRSRKLQQNHQFKHSVPSLTNDKTTSNLELGTDKEVSMPAEEENIPIRQPASHPKPTEREPPAAPTPAMNPHEAAIAWANAQRTKAKELQKANKNKIKEIQKQYKENEKKQRKLAKKNKGKFGSLPTSTSQVMLDPTSSASSLSLSAANLANHRLSGYSGYTDVSSSSRQPESTSAASVRSDPNAERSLPSSAGWQRQRSVSEVHAFELEGDNQILRKR
ncbi:hypothetical protein PISL3812_02310 [Talaromyces islandicus]|uniref:Uncharacterized protein n=1 Tax=Talaromyces islandicus TaxID=28573 RepID=A0A0U1LRE3_TALIS|nr:hypothetical protein PISL3812_02310 [Talaromyces islandicus]